MLVREFSVMREFLTLAEAAAEIGKRPETLDLWVREGKISRVRVSRKTIFFHWPTLRDELLKFSETGKEVTGNVENS